jgi:hypothetical protein
MQRYFTIGTSDSFVSKEWNLVIGLSAIKGEVKIVRKWLIGSTSD